MEKLIKNIAKSQVLKLKDQVNFQDGQIVSKTLVQNDAVSLTLLLLKKMKKSLLISQRLTQWLLFLRAKANSLLVV